MKNYVGAHKYEIIFSTPLNCLFFQNCDLKVVARSCSLVNVALSIFIALPLFVTLIAGRVITIEIATKKRSIQKNKAKKIKSKNFKGVIEKSLILLIWFFFFDFGYNNITFTDFISE